MNVLPEPLRTKVNEQLKGEAVVWMGQPDAQVFRASWRFKGILLGMSMGSIVGVLLFLLGWGFLSPEDTSDTPAGIAYAIMGVGALIVYGAVRGGINGCTIPLHELYIITPTRALLIKFPYNKIDKIFIVQEFKSWQLKNSLVDYGKNGSGSLILHQEITRDSDGDRSTTNRTFAFLKDVAAAEKALNALVQSA